MITTIKDTMPSTGSAFVRRSLAILSAVIFVASTLIAAAGESRDADLSQSGSFDEVTLIHRAEADLGFNELLKRAATNHIKIADALRALEIDAMRSGRVLPPTQFDKLLANGIAKHYSFAPGMLRVDVASDWQSYIIDCKKSTVTALNYLTREAVVSPLSDPIKSWARGLDVKDLPKVTAKASSYVPEIHGYGQNTDFALKVRVQLAPGRSLHDSFEYSYGVDTPRFDCNASISSDPLIAAGLFGPSQTAKVYQSEFEASGMSPKMLVRDAPGDNFTSLHFSLQSFGRFDGTVLRGNFSRTIPPDVFDIPTVFRLRSLSSLNAQETEDVLPP